MSVKIMVDVDVLEVLIDRIDGLDPDLPAGEVDRLKIEIARARASK